MLKEILREEYEHIINKEHLYQKRFYQNGRRSAETKYMKIINYSKGEKI